MQELGRLISILRDQLVELKNEIRKKYIFELTNIYRIKPTRNTKEYINQFTKINIIGTTIIVTKNENPSLEETIKPTSRTII